MTKISNTYFIFKCYQILIEMYQSYYSTVEALFLSFWLMSLIVLLVGSPFYCVIKKLIVWMMIEFPSTNFFQLGSVPSIYASKRIFCFFCFTFEEEATSSISHQKQKVWNCIFVSLFYNPFIAWEDYSYVEQCCLCRMQILPMKCCVAR